MADFKNYDPGLNEVYFRGVLIGGYTEGTFIKAARMEDGFKMKTGASGDTTRVKSRNHNGEVTVTLKGAAPSNSRLSEVAIEDELFSTGYGPLLVKDLNGDTVAEAAYAWVRKMPDIERADDESDVEWIFDCADLKMFVGSSTL